MNVDDSQSQYLSLALLSRQVVDAMLDLIRNNHRQKLGVALPEAIAFLEAATDSRNATISPVRSRTVTSYDQVRTIDELFRPEDRLQMIRTLKVLESPSSSLSETKENALKAIDFFFKIENVALRNFRRPSPRASGVVRGPCPTY